MAGVIPDEYKLSPRVADGLEEAARRSSARETPFTNAFRILALNVRAIAERSQSLKTMLVTSAFPGDGRSTIAANLAIALANDGSQVVLVEGDRRRPALARMLHLTSDAGVPAAERQVSFVPTEVARLTVATRRSKENPAVSLDEGKSLLAMLRGMADFVIVDSPPCTISADPFYLASMVDGALYVVRKRSQSAATQRRICDQYQALGASMLGVVFNEG